MPPIYYSNRPHPLLIVVGCVIMIASFVALAAVFSLASSRAMTPRGEPPPLASEPAPQTVAQPASAPVPAGQAS